jgi:predicted amidophosphoribosyltransferase
MTLDPIIWDELKCGRAAYTEYNCANCGAGLLTTHCSGCGHQFRDNQGRCGWEVPLSRKMVAFLRENGHEFMVDPEIAWRKEQQEWELYYSAPNGK